MLSALSPHLAKEERTLIDKIFSKDYEPLQMQREVTCETKDSIDAVSAARNTPVRKTFQMIPTNTYLDNAEETMRLFAKLRF